VAANRRILIHLGVIYAPPHRDDNNKVGLAMSTGCGKCTENVPNCTEDWHILPQSTKSKLFSQIIRMAHDVFISYSSAVEKATAEICRALEGAHI